MPDSRAATRSQPEVAGGGLGALNSLSAIEARASFAGCCASMRWATMMERGRPYQSAEAVRGQAARSFDALTREDWLQAFAAHDRIGEPPEGDERGCGEQSGVSTASPAELAALRGGNEAYEAKFGHLFLIRAAGGDAAATLAALRERLANHPETELEITSDQQRAITKLRLDDLLTAGIPAAPRRA